MHSVLSTKEKHVLRGLLQRLRTPQLSPDLIKKGPLPRLNAGRKFCLEQYRIASTNNNNNNNVEAASLLRLQSLLAANYYQLQNDLAERARLYELDTSAEVVFTPKEMSRRAAARSGLQMPVLHLDDESVTNSEPKNQ